MKIKCWQGDCPEGKVGCCYECDRRSKCEDACDERCDAGKGKTMTKTRTFERYIWIITALVWAIGFKAIHEGTSGYLIATAMIVSACAWLKVIIPERDEEDV